MAAWATAAFQPAQHSSLSAPARMRKAACAIDARFAASGALHLGSATHHQDLTGGAGDDGRRDIVSLGDSIGGTGASALPSPATRSLLLPSAAHAARQRLLRVSRRAASGGASRRSRCAALAAPRAGVCSERLRAAGSAWFLPLQPRKHTASLLYL